jgi:anti-sigma factor RsiW
MSERVDFSSAIKSSLPVYDVPPALEAWAREQARKVDSEHSSSGELRERGRSSAWHWTQWRVAAGLLVAAAAGLSGGMAISSSRLSPSAATANQVVDAHVRSLLPGHLVDVASSDRHTVKPWFIGQTDIAPPVIDLAAKGFPLLGGRLDYVDGHSAAALAYGRRLHKINLFVWRSDDPDVRGELSMVRGYSVLHWKNGGLSFWAVSDASREDLKEFRANFP